MQYRKVCEFDSRWSYVKAKVIREIPSPNGMVKVVTLVDGWKEVVSYKKRKKAKKK